MRVCPGCGRQTDADKCPHDGLITMDASLLTVSDPMIGKVIAGKYAIVATMGGGGMGAVYKARHTATGGWAALKVMRAAVADSADAIKRFHLEAQNAAVLQSMHTVRVLDFGVDDGLMYLVMEYLEGEPLNETIQRCGRLGWRRACQVARQVLESLWEAHSHERRIVHRDIKPPNIFLVRKVDGSDFVKVIDFGIARALDATGANTRGAIGTPHAMAPEQWRGAGVDGRTDLYAVGCVLYEMLSGRPPFLGNSDATPNERMMQLATAHISQPPHPIDELATEIPPALAKLVHDLLAKAPEDRPQTARDVIIGLDRCLAAPAGDSAAWGDTAAEGVEIQTADLPTLASGTDPSGDVRIHHTPTPAAPKTPMFAPAPAPVLSVTPVPSESHTPAPTSAAAPTPAPASTPPPASIDAQTAMADELELPTQADNYRKKRGWMPIVGLALVWGAAVTYMQADGVNIAYDAEEEPGSRVQVTGVDNETKREKLEQAVETIAEVFADKVEDWSGDKDELPATPPTALAQLVTQTNDKNTEPTVRYSARLSDQDHLNSKGKPLRQAHHVIAQDRANYHRYQRRDPDDESDAVFHDKEARRALRRLLRRAVSKDEAERIVRGTPRVEVQVWGEERAEVTILE